MITTNKILVKKLRSIVNKYDPIGLLEMGCPTDEYDPEIKQIISKFNKVGNVDELLQAIHVYQQRRSEKSKP